MKMIMSGFRYEVLAPSTFIVLLAGLFRRPLPQTVLRNKQTGQSYELPLHLEDQLDIVGDNYGACELSNTWSDKEPVSRLRRASVCCDLLCHALEQAMNGDEKQLSQLANLSMKDLASRIDQRLSALASS